MDQTLVEVVARRPFSHNNFSAVAHGSRLSMPARDAYELEKLGFVDVEADAGTEAHSPIKAPARAKQAPEPLNKMKREPANKAAGDFTPPREKREARGGKPARMTKQGKRHGTR